MHPSFTNSLHAMTHFKQGHSDRNLAKQSNLFSLKLTIHLSGVRLSYAKNPEFGKKNLKNSVKLTKSALESG